MKSFHDIRLCLSMTKSRSTSILDKNRYQYFKLTRFNGIVKNCKYNNIILNNIIIDKIFWLNK